MPHRCRWNCSHATLKGVGAYPVGIAGVDRKLGSGNGRRRRTHQTISGAELALAVPAPAIAYGRSRPAAAMKRTRTHLVEGQPARDQMRRLAQGCGTVTYCAAAVLAPAPRLIGWSDGAGMRLGGAHLPEGVVAEYRPRRSHPFGHAPIAALSKLPVAPTVGSAARGHTTSEIGAGIHPIERESAGN